MADTQVSKAARQSRGNEATQQGCITATTLMRIDDYWNKVDYTKMKATQIFLFNIIKISE